MDRCKCRQQAYNEISVRIPCWTKSESRDSLSCVCGQRPPPGYWRKGGSPCSLHQLPDYCKICQQGWRVNHLPRTGPRCQGGSWSKIQRSLRRPTNGRAIENINLPLHGGQRGRRDNNPRSNSWKNKRGSVVLSHVQRLNRDSSSQHDSHRIHGTIHQSTSNGIRCRV